MREFLVSVNTNYALFLPSILVWHITHKKGAEAPFVVVSCDAGHSVYTPIVIIG